LRTESTGASISTIRITVTDEGISNPINVSRMNKMINPAVATLRKRMTITLQSSSEFFELTT